MTSLVQQLTLSLSLATLLFLRQIGFWASSKNRFFFHWQRSDTLALIAALLAFALLFFLIARLVRRVWPARAGIILQWLTIILVADVVVGYAGSGTIWGRSTVLAGTWAVVTGIGLYTSSRSAFRFVARGRDILIALAWLAPILLGQMLLWRAWDVQPAAADVRPAAGPGRTPVFIFIFDGWSYERSYQDDQLLPLFRNLRGLAGRSLEFTRTHSQGHTTMLSLPQLVFQRKGTLHAGNGVTHWDEGRSTTRSPQVPSLFVAARARGYRTSIIGFYLPYRGILGDQVEHITSHPHAPKGNTLPGGMWIAAVRNLNFLADPLSQLLWLEWYTRAYSENWARLNHEVRNGVRDLIRRSDGSTFAMVHAPQPHGPFVFEEDGSYRGALAAGPGTPDDYRRHLQVLDLAIGDIISEMEAVGVLDPALVIITSDHSWKVESDTALKTAPDALTWVPLFVKLPHQTAPHRVSEPFCLGQIGALIQRVIDTTLTERNVLQELSGLPSTASCGRRIGSPVSTTIDK